MEWKIWHETRLSSYGFEILKDKDQYVEMNGSLSLIGKD
jgi:hypothetical protein